MWIKKYQVEFKGKKKTIRWNLSKRNYQVELGEKAIRWNLDKKKLSGGICIKKITRWNLD